VICIGNVEHGQRIMAETSAHFSSVTMQVISRTKDTILQGGVVFENWTGEGGTCLAHVAGFNPHWLDRDFMFIMFDYPFKQLDCRSVFVQVASKNDKSLHFTKSIGFVECARIEDVFPDDDMILLRLKRDDCRFLNIKPRSVSRRTDTWESPRHPPRLTIVA